KAASAESPVASAALKLRKLLNSPASLFCKSARRASKDLCNRNRASLRAMAHLTSKLATQVVSKAGEWSDYSLRAFLVFQEICSRRFCRRFRKPDFCPLRRKTYASSLRLPDLKVFCLSTHHF